jgi:hypothetical protein
MDDAPLRGHGSTYEYQYGRCRCELCRAANAADHRRIMERYKAKGGRGDHGTTYRYDTGCRCDGCREAKNRRSREWKRKMRAARQTKQS